MKWKGIEDGELEFIGIRFGEKLHEEMISDVEWMRTIDMGENYLISENIINNESKSYNSLESKMDKEDVYEFLKKSKVI